MTLFEIFEKEQNSKDINKFMLEKIEAKNKVQMMLCQIGKKGRLAFFAHQLLNEESQ